MADGPKHGRGGNPPHLGSDGGLECRAESGSARNLIGAGRRRARRRPRFEAGSRGQAGRRAEARWSGPRRSHLQPHWSVKRHGEVVSHFGPPAMHICRPAYLAVRQRLAARCSVGGGTRAAKAVAGATPSPRAGTGSGPSVFSHPCHRPPRGRSRPIIPAREGDQRRFEAAGYSSSLVTVCPTS